MKIFCRLLLICLLCCLACGCAPRPADWFAPFKGGFSADVAGTRNGLSFSATVQAEPVNDAGQLPLTVTFYAPKTLSGTVLKSDGAGNVTISAGPVQLDHAAGFDELLQLFPINVEIFTTTLTDKGRTKLTFEGGSMEFLKDGTPIAATWGDVSVTILSFSVN